MREHIEWPTVWVAAACYAAWGVGIAVLPALSLPLAVVVTGFAIALHGSLTHEVIHGHPFRSAQANAALVWPTLNLAIPFGRFRDTHLAHHLDSVLTDPLDDPESNYLTPEAWHGRPSWQKRMLSFNNTLLGRLTIGPAIGQIAFLVGEWRLLRRGDRSVLRAWLAFVPSVVAVTLMVVALGEMPVWAYLIACYLGLALLRIRTFLEHQAHKQVRGRTVIIEDRGPLAFLFLNNNLHVVHHMHPKVPWYVLPTLYFSDRAKYQRRNGGYVFRSYGEIFARYFLRRKDPVPHPYFPQSR